MVAQRAHWEQGRNIQFIVEPDGAAGQFDHYSFQLHDDMSDHSSIFHHCTPNLDVEVLVGGLAVGCKDVIADSREVKDVPIKGLEVEVTPCAAHTAIVKGVASCGFKISSKFPAIFCNTLPFDALSLLLLSLASVQKAHLLFSVLSSYFFFS